MGTSSKTSSKPFAAMLAQDIDEQRGLNSYLYDANWCASQKVDGDRLMVVKHNGNVTCLNRLGEPSKHNLSRDLIQSLLRLEDGWWFDGELVDGHYHAFDVVASPELPDGRRLVQDDTVFHRRYEVLVKLYELWQPKGTTVLPVANTDMEKNALWYRLKKNNAEGLMFRHKLSFYHFGERRPELRKYKFWKTCDVILYNIGREGKASAGMAVYDGEKLIDVGSVKLAQSMLNIALGQPAEIKFLYVTKDLRLYQPSILRLRDDKHPDDCTYDQLVKLITSKEVLVS